MSSIAKRTVSLPPEHAAYIDRLVASGLFASASEVVRAGLRALQERDLAVFRTGPDHPPISDELMSYGLFGAFQTMRMRATWDDRFSRGDVMWNNVAMFLAVLALYDGTLDVEALKRRYADLIDEVAAMTPPVIPGFET